MNVGWNIETALSLGALAAAVTGSVWIMRVNWKQYGALLLLSGVVGVALCQLFLHFGFYTFPVRLFPAISRMPIFVILTVFPFYVMAGVRYSPRQWGWKIPFYWMLVHVGVLAEGIIESRTSIIQYGGHWGLWDSYIWWWLYLLVFEWVGGLIVKPENRKPLHPDHLRYGRLGWFIVHFLLMLTIFLAGFQLAETIIQK